MKVRTRVIRKAMLMLPSRRQGEDNAWGDTA
jgi:hypothetical protein